MSAVCSSECRDLPGSSGRCLVDDLEKLKMLLHHWLEHNNEHALLYRNWAAKASSSGNRRLADLLEKLCQETEKLNELFEKAIKAAEA